MTIVIGIPWTLWIASTIFILLLSIPVVLYGKYRLYKMKRSLVSPVDSLEAPKEAAADSSKETNCPCGVPDCKGHKNKAWNAEAPMRVPGKLLGALYFHR